MSQMPTRDSACPQLTVLMPVYDGERFLDQAIQSIRVQTFTEFEFLIIDDGSSDTTPDILARHAAGDNRIRVIRQENRGLIATLNRGFQEARGKFIARMDADDVARPHRLAAQMDFLKAHLNIALVGGAIDVIDPQGRTVQTIKLPELPDQIRYHMRELGCALAHPTVVFRRQAVIDAGGLRLAYRHAEDYDLWLRMIEKNDFANLPDVVLGYRRHEHSISAKHTTQQILSAFCARAAAKLRLQGGPDPTCNVELITPEVVRSLGVDQPTLDAEMLRGLHEAAEMAIQEGRRSAAAEFLTLAHPFASPAKLRETAVGLNRKAITVTASGDEQARHRSLLLDVSPDTYREVFGVGPVVTKAHKTYNRPAGGGAATSSGLSDMVKRNRHDTDRSEECLRHYERAFAHLRTQEIAVLELGVSRGALYMWRDYFPQGAIVGVDLAPPADFHDTTGRCRLIQGDQGNSAVLLASALSASPTGYHIIIDDASHLGELTANTFKALFYDCLLPGGFYAIEDWGTGYWDSWPDGAQPEPPTEPNFPKLGKRFPSHDMGMVGFVKQLIDECALSDICHPRFGLPRPRKDSIRGMNLFPGLVIIEKAQE